MSHIYIYYSHKIRKMDGGNVEKKTEEDKEMLVAGVTKINCVFMLLIL